MIFICFIYRADNRDDGRLRGVVDTIHLQTPQFLILKLCSIYYIFINTSILNIESPPGRARR